MSRCVVNHVVFVFVTAYRPCTVYTVHASKSACLNAFAKRPVGLRSIVRELSYVPERRVCT